MSQKDVDEYISGQQYMYGAGRQQRKNKTRNNRKKHASKKWSAKYKKSIKCKNPKGFSQKQYCKYGQKRTKRRQ
jgi:hypothetical protein